MFSLKSCVKIENNEECSRAVNNVMLQVRESWSADNELSGNLTSPRRFISRNNSLLVTFLSNTFNTFPGFTAKFKGLAHINMQDIV